MTFWGRNYLHFIDQKTEFQAGKSAEMITLTWVFGSALLTEPNELKVVETECWSQKCPWSSLLCLKSPLPHCRRSFFLFVDMSLTGRTLEISLRYGLEISSSNPASGSLLFQHVCSLWHLTGGNFRHSGASQSPVLRLLILENASVVYYFIPVLSSCVTLGKSVNHSEPPVPIL